VPFGTHYLLPLVPDFLARHPISHRHRADRCVVDLLEERADVAIRVGPLRDAAGCTQARREPNDGGGIARLSRAARRTNTPTDLAKHNMLGFCFVRLVEGWPFRDARRRDHRRAAGNASVSDGEAMRHLALAGLGIGRLATFHVDRDVAAGRLVPVLENYNPGDTETVHAIFVGQGGHVPARVRAFLDYLADKVRIA